MLTESDASLRQWEPACKDRETGKVYTGFAHYDIIQRIISKVKKVDREEAYAEMERNYDYWDSRIESGFLLPGKKFLDRKAADAEWKRLKGAYWEDPDKGWLDSMDVDAEHGKFNNNAA